MLQLWFTDEQYPELVRTELTHPHSSRPIIAVRGKSPGAYRRGEATFQWTQAVQALCIFLLRAAEQGSADSGAEFHPTCSGDAGSPAASLDFAVGKPPAWLIEMFGESRSGDPFIRRLILRTNPERKRGGDVELSLNSSLLPPNFVHVFVGTTSLKDANELSALRFLIEGRWKTSSKLKARNRYVRAASRVRERDCGHPLEARSDFVDTLRSCFADESVRALQYTDIFSRAGLERVRLRIERDLSLAGEERLSARLLEGAMTSTSADRLGIVPPELKRRLIDAPPLNVALPCGNPGATEIFFSLQQQEHLPFEIDFRYHYAIEILRKILSGGFAEPPALCLLGLAPAATLVAQGTKSGYRPLMVMPAVSHRIVAPQSKKASGSRLERGELILLNEEFSTSQIYFDLLSYSGELNKSRIKARHAEPDEAFSWLQSEDEERRALLFFPYHAINRHLNSCDYLDEVRGDTHVKDFILFAHESLFADKLLTQAVCAVIRDTWLRLRSGGQDYHSALDLMTRDPEFCQTLHRFSGALPPNPQRTR